MTGANQRDNREIRKFHCKRSKEKVLKGVNEHGVTRKKEQKDTKLTNKRARKIESKRERRSQQGTK